VSATPVIGPLTEKWLGEGTHAGALSLSAVPPFIGRCAVSECSPGRQRTSSPHWGRRVRAARLVAELLLD
jgi:hypothetical protein